MIELSLLDYKMLKYLPSHLACSCMYLVNKINKTVSWSKKMKVATNYDENDVKLGARDLLNLLKRS